MDGSRFDQLARHLSTTRITRLTALRGLAAGALASAVGIGLTTEEVGAKKKGRRKPKKVKVCFWSASGGTQGKVKKSKLAGLLSSNTCARQGDCTGTNPCAAGTVPPPPPGTVPPAGGGCTSNAQCSGGLVCISGSCQNCTSFTQCTGQQVCIDGRCAGNEICGGGRDGFKCVEPLDCADISGSNIDRCQAVEFSFIQGFCESDADCTVFGADRFCRLSYCTKVCAATADCNDATAPQTNEECFTDLCLI